MPPPPKKNKKHYFLSSQKLISEQGFRLASLFLSVLLYYVTFSFLPYSELLRETSLAFIFIVLTFNVTALTFQNSKPLYLEN